MNKSRTSRNELLGIIIPMPIEARCFSPSFKRIGSIYSLNDKTLIAVSGMKELAAQAVLALHQYHVRCFISYGTAVALAPDLAPGALCIPQEIVHESGCSFETDSYWRQQLLFNIDEDIIYREESLLHTDKILKRSDEKQHLFQKTGAIAADMESFYIAQKARQLGIPFLVIRAIIDRAEFNMPDILAHSFSSQEVISVFNILTNVCRQPSILFPLFSLTKNFSKARKMLKQIAYYI